MPVTPNDTPEVFLPYSYYDAGRTKSAYWVLGQDAEGKDVVADLTLHHHKDRKQFIARLGRVHREHHETSDGRTYTSTIKTFDLSGKDGFNDTTILVKAVARYSAKARDAAFEEALLLVRGLADQPEVAKFFENEHEHAG